MVVQDGEELPISIYLTQYRLAHQLGSSLLLQVLDLPDPMLVGRSIIQLCSLATQDIQYSQISGRIIGYEVGEPQAFVGNEGNTINE